MKHFVATLSLPPPPPAWLQSFRNPGRSYHLSQEFQAFQWIFGVILFFFFMFNQKAQTGGDEVSSTLPQALLI